MSDGATVVLPHAEVNYVDNIRSRSEVFDEVSISKAGVLGLDSKGRTVFVYAHAVTLIREVRG